MRHMFLFYFIKVRNLLEKEKKSIKNWGDKCRNPIKLTKPNKWKHDTSLNKRVKITRGLNHKQSKTRYSSDIGDIIFWLYLHV